MSMSQTYDKLNLFNLAPAFAWAPVFENNLTHTVVISYQSENTQDGMYAIPFRTKCAICICWNTITITAEGNFNYWIQVRNMLCKLQSSEQPFKTFLFAFEPFDTLQQIALEPFPHAWIIHTNQP